MREIVFDTETTGVDPKDHRVIEIGALEVINRVPTGRVYHQYINPERKIEQEAINVHGITDERVAEEPVYAEISDAFMDFIADSPLVAHNANFDIGFINAELGRIGKDKLTNEVVDTLAIARKKFPGARASLDALCQRFEIDLSVRVYHGALLDAKLLADVYLELTGGRQPDLMGEAVTANSKSSDQNYRKTEVKAARSFPATSEELEAHKSFVSDKVPGQTWYKKED